MATLTHSEKFSQLCEAFEHARAKLCIPGASLGVLMQGEHPKGMVSFKAVLKPEDVENIRQYIIKRANEDKALGEK